MTTAGADEMTHGGRIGRNELATMQGDPCLLHAQASTRRFDPATGDGIYGVPREKFASAPTKGHRRTALYEGGSARLRRSPLGPLLAQRSAWGGTGYHGYRYKTSPNMQVSAGGPTTHHRQRMRSGFCRHRLAVRYATPRHVAHGEPRGQSSTRRTSSPTGESVASAMIPSIGLKLEEGLVPLRRRPPCGGDGPEACARTRFRRCAPLRGISAPMRRS
jgi:hypothetical protein